VEYIIDCLILFLIYILIYIKKLKYKNKLYKIKFSLFYFYIMVVFLITIMPFRIIVPGRNKLFLERLNLIPFRDIYRHYLGGTQDVILNIIMFIPFGFLISFFKEKNILETIILSFSFSLFIEVTQLLYAWTTIYSKRTSDITDVITNTIGGIIGYLIYKIFCILKKRIAVIFVLKR